MVDTNATGGRSVRKKRIIDDPEENRLMHEELYFLRTFGYSWVEISELLGIHEKFIKRWRKAENFKDPRYCDLTDQELDLLVGRYIEDHPERGEKMMDGLLASNNSRVKRTRLRESMKRVDPEGVE